MDYDSELDDRRPYIIFIFAFALAFAFTLTFGGNDLYLPSVTGSYYTFTTHF